MTTRSHYDTLGLAPTASASEVREAYRRLAREFHPDRTVGSAAGSDRMPQINEAYRVLSDPGRRAVYDAERRGAPTPRPVADAAQRTDYSSHFSDGPARIPWRSLLFFAGIAIFAILVLAQFSKPADPGEPDNLLRNGDCVEILDNNDAKEVRCTGTDDLVVRQFISFGRECSNGWVAHRDFQGMGLVCIEFPDGS